MDYMAFLGTNLYLWVADTHVFLSHFYLPLFGSQVMIAFPLFFQIVCVLCIYNGYALRVQVNKVQSLFVSSCQSRF